MRLAKLSFDLWGALSPTGNRGPPGTEQPEKNTPETEVPQSEQASAKRSISQAELESSLYRVRFFFINNA